MSIDETLVLGRLLERILIVAFSGSALILGWNLFRVGVVTRQVAELSYKDWRVSLKQVGPGVFFALFGAAVLCVALLKNLEISGGTTSSPDRRKIAYLGENRDQLRKYVAALNTVTNSSDNISIDPNLIKAIETDLKLAKPILENLRGDLLLLVFSAKDLQEWKAHGDSYLSNSANVAPDLRLRLKEISPWMTDTVTSRR